MNASWWRGLTKCGALEKGMSSHFSIFNENAMNSIKRQKDRTLKGELLRPLAAQYAIGEEGKITPERIK